MFILPCLANKTPYFLQTALSTAQQCLVCVASPPLHMQWVHIPTECLQPWQSSFRVLSSAVCPRNVTTAHNNLGKSLQIHISCRTHRWHAPVQPANTLCRSSVAHVATGAVCPHAALPWNSAQHPSLGNTQTKLPLEHSAVMQRPSLKPIVAAHAIHTGLRHSEATTAASGCLPPPAQHSRSSRERH